MSPSYFVHALEIFSKKFVPEVEFLNEKFSGPGVSLGEGDRYQSRWGLHKTFGYLQVAFEKISDSQWKLKKVFYTKYSNNMNSKYIIKLTLLSAGAQTVELIHMNRIALEKNKLPRTGLST